MQFEKTVTKLNAYTEHLRFPTKLEESLEKILKNEGFSNYKVSIKCVSNYAVSFQADLFEVRIEGTVNEEPKELNLFIKYQITESVLTLFDIDLLYLHEKQVYTKVFPILNDLEREANVQNNERYNVVKYYDTGYNAAVIMENIALKGYFVYSKWNIITIEYAEMALKELAKFHSTSFVMEKKRPDVYENVIQKTKTAIVFNEEYKNCFTSMFGDILTALNCEEAKEKISEFAETAFAKYMDVFNASKQQTNVLCHGDYKVNNIMMKEEEGVLSKLTILDYQCIYYGSPVNDIIFFIFGATDQKFRKNHLKHLKDVYYNSLENYLTYFGIKAKNVYPRSEFEKDFERKLHYAVIAAGHLIPIVLMPEDEILDIHGTVDISSTKISSTSSDEYKKRMSEVVEDCIRWGVL